MTPVLTGVVAMAADRAIGIRQGLPWRLSEDMKLFKRLTMGHPILMGRKTWESLGRPLPGRQNIVLTRDASFRAEGAVVIHDVAELESLELQDKEVMVIGGAQIYELLLPNMVLSLLKRRTTLQLWQSAWIWKRCVNFYRSINLLM